MRQAFPSSATGQIRISLGHHGVVISRAKRGIDFITTGKSWLRAKIAFARELHVSTSPPFPDLIRTTGP